MKDFSEPTPFATIERIVPLGTISWCHGCGHRVPAYVLTMKFESEGKHYLCLFCTTELWTQHHIRAQVDSKSSSSAASLPPSDTPDR